MLEKLKKGIFPFLIAFSALSVSASAAFYSVTGLSKLFAGASFEVIIMAGSLEVAKLVIASLLYQYWDTINKWLRGYLTIATIVLVLITSMGIYGFLSAAYQETYSKLLIQENEIEFIENKAQFYEDDIARYDIELARISENINILSSAKASGIQVRDTTSSTGFRQTISTTELRMAQKRIEVEEENRSAVQAQRQVAADSLQAFRLEILDLQNTSETAGELGPLQYLSGLTGTPMDKIINWLLLVIIFVFDPLAISLVVAANFAFAQAFPKREEDESTPLNSVWDDVDEYPEPNDDLKRAAERYKNFEYAEDILDRPAEKTVPHDISVDKENAEAWGQVADELARHVELEEWDATLNDGLNDLPWEQDEEVQDFLERADEPGPWPEEDDKIHTVGGLTNDKESGFMDFQKQQDDNDTERLISEEWDEDHALDQVLNSMVEDLEDHEEELKAAEEELKAAEEELKAAENEKTTRVGTFPNENNPTSVAAQVQSIVEKVETPHLPQEPVKTTTLPPADVPKVEVKPSVEINEDELFDEAMRIQAEKDKQAFLRKNGK